MSKKNLTNSTLPTTPKSRPHLPHPRQAGQGSSPIRESGNGAAEATNTRKPGRAGHKRLQCRPQQAKPDDERPLFDERLPGLLLDALRPLGAATASAATGIGYREARQAMTVSEDEKLQLCQALEQVAAKHASFFLEHKSLFEAVVLLSAINAAHLDHVLTIAKQPENSGSGSDSGQPAGHACSRREALVAALLILAPLVIAAVVLIVKGRNN